MTFSTCATPVAVSPASDDLVFEHICQDLTRQGYSIQPAALPAGLAQALALQASDDSLGGYRQAGIGRGSQHLTDRSVRNDQIRWIDEQGRLEAKWLDWSTRLRGYLNRRLFLGLSFFESHFAHYPPGHFYQRHVDAFRGQANRILTLVTYLNHDWQPGDGGELVLYRDEQDVSGIRITPQMGTLVVFLSEEFPHEVLPAQRDRYSIAGWFRSAGAQQLPLSHDGHIPGR